MLSLRDVAATSGDDLTITEMRAQAARQRQRKRHLEDATLEALYGEEENGNPRRLIRACEAEEQTVIRAINREYPALASSLRALRQHTPHADGERSAEAPGPRARPPPALSAAQLTASSSASLSSSSSLLAPSVLPAYPRVWCVPAGSIPASFFAELCYERNSASGVGGAADTNSVSLGSAAMSHSSGGGSPRSNTTSRGDWREVADGTPPPAPSSLSASTSYSERVRAASSAGAESISYSVSVRHKLNTSNKDYAHRACFVRVLRELLELPPSATAPSRPSVLFPTAAAAAVSANDSAQECRKVLARWPRTDSWQLPPTEHGSAAPTPTSTMKRAKLNAVLRSIDVAARKREQWNRHVRKYNDHQQQQQHATADPSARAASADSPRDSVDAVPSSSSSSGDDLYWPARVVRLVGEFDADVFCDSFRGLGLLQQYEQLEDVLALALSTPMHVCADVVFCFDETSEQRRLRIAPRVLCPQADGHGMGNGSSPSSVRSRARALAARGATTAATTTATATAASTAPHHPSLPSASSVGASAAASMLEPEQWNAFVAEAYRFTDEEALAEYKDSLLVRQAACSTTASTTTTTTTGAKAGDRAAATVAEAEAHCPLLLPSTMPDVISISNYSYTEGVRRPTNNEDEDDSDGAGGGGGGASRVLPLAPGLYSSAHPLAPDDTTLFPGGNSPLPPPPQSSSSSSAVVAARQRTPPVESSATLNRTTISNNPLSLHHILAGPICQTQSVVFLRPTVAMAAAALREALEDIAQRWLALRQALIDRLTAFEEQLPTLRAYEEYITLPVTCTRLLPTMTTAWRADTAPLLACVAFTRTDARCAEAPPPPALWLPDAATYESPFIGLRNKNGDEILPPEPYAPGNMNDEELRRAARLPRLQSSHASKAKGTYGHGGSAYGQPTQTPFFEAVGSTGEDAIRRPSSPAVALDAAHSVSAAAAAADDDDKDPRALVPSARSARRLDGRGSPCTATAVPPKPPLARSPQRQQHVVDNQFLSRQPQPQPRSARSSAAVRPVARLPEKESNAEGLALPTEGLRNPAGRPTAAAAAAADGDTGTFGAETSARLSSRGSREHSQVSRLSVPFPVSAPTPVKLSHDASRAACKSFSAYNMSINTVQGDDGKEQSNSNGNGSDDDGERASGAHARSCSTGRSVSPSMVVREAAQRQQQLERAIELSQRPHVAPRQALPSVLVVAPTPASSTVTGRSTDCSRQPSASRPVPHADRRSHATSDGGPTAAGPCSSSPFNVLSGLPASGSAGHTAASPAAFGHSVSDLSTPLFSTSVRSLPTVDTCGLAQSLVQLHSVGAISGPSSASRSPASTSGRKSIHQERETTVATAAAAAASRSAHGRPPSRGEQSDARWSALPIHSANGQEAPPRPRASTSAAVASAAAAAVAAAATAPALAPSGSSPRSSSPSLSHPSTLHARPDRARSAGDSGPSTAPCRPHTSASTSLDRPALPDDRCRRAHRVHSHARALSSSKRSAPASSRSNSSSSSLGAALCTVTAKDRSHGDRQRVIDSAALAAGGGGDAADLQQKLSSSLPQSSSAPSQPRSHTQPPPPVLPSSPTAQRRSASRAHGSATASDLPSTLTSDAARPGMPARAALPLPPSPSARSGGAVSHRRRSHDDHHRSADGNPNDAALHSTGDSATPSLLASAPLPSPQQLKLQQQQRYRRSPSGSSAGRARRATDDGRGRDSYAEAGEREVEIPSPLVQSPILAPSSSAAVIRQHSSRLSSLYSFSRPATATAAERESSRHGAVAHDLFSASSARRGGGAAADTSTFSRTHTASGSVRFVDGESCAPSVSQDASALAGSARPTKSVVVRRVVRRPRQSHGSQELSTPSRGLSAHARAPQRTAAEAAAHYNSSNDDSGNHYSRSARGGEVSHDRPRACAVGERGAAGEKKLAKHSGEDGRATARRVTRGESPPLTDSAVSSTSSPALGDSRMHATGSRPGRPAPAALSSHVITAAHHDPVARWIDNCTSPLKDGQTHAPQRTPSTAMTDNRHYSHRRRHHHSAQRRAVHHTEVSQLSRGTSASRSTPRARQGGSRAPRSPLQDSNQSQSTLPYAQPALIAHPSHKQQQQQQHSFLLTSTTVTTSANRSDSSYSTSGSSPPSPPARAPTGIGRS